ncbi:hypothetical protein F4820DRAFT_462990 [Hypoxylon rubiginosum]|uniref:Uncharacterized protein n=1 Tax=Hypoxylon rubiginosum TaxID=110542 RepID=A0ACB9YH76_9PEZI|nr:hypothetical protein F4820DRAFT_462990 [Hypoxylon rubiginosum]
MEHNQEAKRKQEESRRQRQEAERKQEESRRQREEAERKQEESRRQRQEAERKQEESRRQREEAEHQYKDHLNQTLWPYLLSCHSYSLSIPVVTDPSATTGSLVANPRERYYPKRIVKWDSFMSDQHKTWKKVQQSQSFLSAASHPSKKVVEGFKSYFRRIRCETALRTFEWVAVEAKVRMLVEEANNEKMMQDSFGLHGKIEFQSHGNFKGGPKQVDGSESEATAEHSEQFCIYGREGSPQRIIYAIEYKLPHKLPKDAIIAALDGSEIQPDRDIINRSGDTFEFYSKAITTAAITRAYSSMCKKGTSYGYVCTGEAFIFLHIPQDDPTTVYYSPHVPAHDVKDDDPDRLRYTAISQVFAFVLRAIQAPVVPQSWFTSKSNDKRSNIWPEKDPSPYIPPKGRKTRENKTSPYNTLSNAQKCQPQADNPTRGNNDSDHSSGKASAPLPPRLGQGTFTQLNKPASESKGGQKQGQSRGDHDAKQHRQSKPSIESREYCTQECLVGLAYGGSMDKECPNFTDHGQQHLEPLAFRNLIRDQLAHDRGPDADATPLHLSGAVGSLFKVRLSAYGYTLVAKGVIGDYSERLDHEIQVYDRLRPIQGVYVPVCLGKVDLVLPYYYDGNKHNHFLFLSWAGQPLSLIAKTVANNASIIDDIATAFRAVHAQQILHCDGAPRNILYEPRRGKPMVIDFERANIYSHRKVGPVDRIRRTSGTQKGKRNFKRILNNKLN